VGLVYDRRHTRLISELGGLSRQMPIYGALFAIIMFSSMGLPGLNGFIGEFLILLGAFRVHWAWGAFAVTGIVLGAAYMLWLYQRTMLGEITKEENKGLPDLSLREIATLAPIILFCFWIGLYPAPLPEGPWRPRSPNVLRIVDQGAAGKAVRAKACRAPGRPGAVPRGQGGRGPAGRRGCARPGRGGGPSQSPPRPPSRWPRTREPRDDLPGHPCRPRPAGAGTGHHAGRPCWCWCWISWCRGASAAGSAG